VITPDDNFADFTLMLTAVRGASNGFIRVRICNVGAAAQDPPNINFRWMVFHN